MNTNPNDLINYERTWRTVICINPAHPTVKFDSNDVGTIPCPTCKFPMVVEVKTPFTIIGE